MKHKHYDLIMAWAEGSKIETLDSETGKWKQTEPLWFEDEEYRVYDPYRELREAVKDPNKEVALIKYSDGSPIEEPNWESGKFWDFTNLPDYYAIRDKPKTTKKVKMWQWLLQNDSNKFFASNRFYLSAEDVTKDHITSKVIGIVPWTEIEVEVEMDMGGNIV
jgi:hypothetical protein